MPAGDRTGPMGQGPMTGRGAGYCAGFPVPGFMNPGPGLGWGFGRGWGRGRGRGWGRGWGRAWGWCPSYPYPAYDLVPPPVPQESAQALKAQAEYFESALESIRKRIAELEATQQTEQS
jgi:hypothetical protein